MSFQFIIGGSGSGKSHRLYKMKSCPGRRTGAGNIAGILRNLRFDEHNIKLRQIITTLNKLNHRNLK